MSERPQPALHALRVLVADDEPIVRRMVETTLRLERDLEVVALAGDALDAVRLARIHQPDVALVDVRMPGGGGPEAVRGIRRTSPSTRILVHSAHEDPETLIEMVRAGADGYLVKESDASGIPRALRRIAAGERVLSPSVAGSLMSELSRILNGDGDLPEGTSAAEAAVHRVLEEGQLRMVFQPIADLETGAVVGVEALARFPSAAAHAPQVWFQQAWAVGLGPDLELAALQAAFEGAEPLPSHLFLAVNLSPQAITEPEVLAVVCGETRRPLQVEITEHVQVSDYQALRRALLAVRESGCRIAVDDVGAGYASMRHILELAPDVIKYDVSFNRNIDQDAGRQALVAALARFAAEMGADLVAEGIETPSELETLRELGVRHGQGFVLRRPAPVAHLDLSDLERTV